jgi:hypothetical protein
MLYTAAGRRSDDVTFAARPSLARCRLGRTTIQVVKAYQIQRIKGGMKFNCARCAHSVSTLDFDAKAGNLRTQAATAINNHATKAHHEPLIVSPSDSQQRSWR